MGDTPESARAPSRDVDVRRDRDAVAPTVDPLGSQGLDAGAATTTVSVRGCSWERQPHWHRSARHLSRTWRRLPPRHVAPRVSSGIGEMSSRLVYGVVAGVLLVRLAIGTLRTRRLVGRSVMSHGRLTSAACASPVTVGWLRPVVILPETWREWSHSRLDAVLTHEHAHVRRRDPLVQWLALLNRAVFWFHPLAWWLERRLSVLAEQTCDDAVLACGHDPHDYSEYLLDTARVIRAWRAGESCGRLHARDVPAAAHPPDSRWHVFGSCLAGPEDPVPSPPAWPPAAFCLVATPVRALSQRGAIPSRLIVRPLQPRWIPPDSTLPQPVSLEWLDGDEWAFEVQSILTSEEHARVR